ncbi:hypothetical protein HPB51_028963 [Rhipicephalus microplus]|uniref:Uncharacterized protein n=1 Tax=Rhipicephalus microplus TaxID=6941 RepID=A0A9J6CVH3_RHIMP|nr:hypothetical protein HPB51_028963 [Rhipicephalus microplus]
MDRLLATSELAGIPVTACLSVDRSQSSGVVQGVDGDYSDDGLPAAVTSEVPVIAATRQGTSPVLWFASTMPPTRIWLRERLLATIKAPASTYLPNRKAQAVVRASPSGTDGPQLKQPTGKSYAAAVGAPSKMAVSLTHPGQSGAQQWGLPAGLKQPGSTKHRPPMKLPSKPHMDQENATLKLQLRAVAHQLPPENQLRFICLQAVGVHFHSSHHG